MVLLGLAHDGLPHRPGQHSTGLDCVYPGFRISSQVMKLFVDWGTSNLRAWRVDDAGQVVARHASDQGLLVAAKAGFEGVFDRVVEALGATGTTPALLFGMVGSQKGWLEVPYAPAPASAAEIAGSALQVPNRPNTWIIGGVADQFAGDRPEVMRGEEVQCLGVMSGHPEVDRVCLPGTHTKWVSVADQRIGSFSTYMTGELFSWVTHHSILATQIEGDGFDQDGFERGLDLSSEPGALTSALFQLRTRCLAGSLQPKQVRSAASGLLIGHELASAGPAVDSKIAICASPALAGSYRVACEHFGIDCIEVDPERAAIDGLLTLSPLLPS